MSQLQFHIFGGANIRASLSPTIHNAAFAHHHLPHRYTTAECTSLSEISHLITSPTFGGASITMPHKLTAFEHCTEVSDSARAIGAINTLLTTRNGKEVLVKGDNTDWSGLYALINEHLSQQGVTSGQGTGKVGLVIGAGGAARAAVYALLQAEFSTIVIWNRTVGKAKEIIRDFDAIKPGEGIEMKAVGEVTGIGAVDVVIGTIPGDVKAEEDFRGLFEGGEKPGLCLEMAYKPKVTPLMRVAERHGWVVRDGLEVLLRQGFEQYRLWTGLEAPEGVMREAIGDVKSKV